MIGSRDVTIAYCILGQIEKKKQEMRLSPEAFRGDRIQRNFLGQTAESRREDFPTRRGLTPPPSSGRVEDGGRG